MVYNLYGIFTSEKQWEKTDVKSYWNFHKNVFIKHVIYNMNVLYLCIYVCVYIVCIMGVCVYNVYIFRQFHSCEKGSENILVCACFRITGRSWRYASWMSLLVRIISKMSNLARYQNHKFLYILCFCLMDISSDHCLSILWKDFDKKCFSSALGRFGIWSMVWYRQLLMALFNVESF